VKIKHVVIGLLVFIVISLCAFLIINQPREERPWLEEYQKTATTEISSTTVTTINARDWTYTDTVLSTDWLEMTVAPSEITGAWFIVEPFGGIEGIGHTFLSFEFRDGTFLSFSIQARQESTEEYSAIMGAFNSYELAYQWGTERDFIARRLLFLQHDIRLYKLAISPEDAQRLFMALALETNELAAKPRFYNTLTANCTNMLAKSVNKHYKDRLPYDISWNLTGYSDLYLMDQGLIERTESNEATRAAADLTPFRDSISKIATSSPEEFSATIRTLLAK
jgi:hypothetical protein